MALNSLSRLSIAMLTKEWPPEIYGGAGVHVSNLVANMKQIAGVDVKVHCFGQQRNDAFNFELTEDFNNLNSAEQTLLINMDMSAAISNFNLVHSHTWYSNFAGFIFSQMTGKPHVMTAHSLEPLRPWKADQLGSGYAISSWIEKKAIENAAAVISVSDGMKSDILKNYPDIDPHKLVTIRNGIDTARFSPKENESKLAEFGITGEYALFVGRITRQKGLAHLLRAWQHVPNNYGLVIAASNPDESSIANEVSNLIQDLQASRKNIIWMNKVLPENDLVNLLTAAKVFVCPSVYEPLGIVNLEAMACETAVVASNVGGIPEVVKDKETGILVDFNQESSIFELRLAEAISSVLSDTTLAKDLGVAGRRRAVNEFGWDKVVAETLKLYRSLNV